MLLAGRSCIEPFEPVIEESAEVMVINGMITDQPGVHYVEISRSTPYNEPLYEPLGGCVVTVTDENGEIIHFLENEIGKYSANLSGSFLAVGKSYSVHVITPNQKEYRSDYDILTACPPIDTIYYEVEIRGTSNPDFSLGGIQFYMDLTGRASDSRNFMWQLEETWEHHAPYLGRYIYWGGEAMFDPTYDILKCYETLPIRELHTASTRHLSVNALKRNSLNFVSNETDRLRIKYSLLVKQQSLSENTYEYWEKIESQSNDSGGLYETQPSSAIGNIYNTTDPDEIVLGVFYATQQQSRRLTFANHFEFKIPYLTCELDTINNLFLLGGDFPYYLISIHQRGDLPPYLTGDRICFDCRIRGGTNVKPDFW